MEIVITLAVIALLAVVIYFTWRSKTNWSAIYEDSGGVSEEASDQYAYLLKEGIRCRLKHISAGGQSAGTAVAAVEGQEKVRVEVHKDDLDKANRLLEDFNPNRVFKI